MTEDQTPGVSKNLVLQCPQCRAPVHWNERFPHRPFCSARCKQLDFGDWAAEKNTIPGEPVYPSEDTGDYGES